MVQAARDSGTQLECDGAAADLGPEHMQPRKTDTCLLATTAEAARPSTPSTSKIIFKKKEVTLFKRH